MVNVVSMENLKNRARSAWVAYSSRARAILAAETELRLTRLSFVLLNSLMARAHARVMVNLRAKGQ